jgi:hypothetical protein
MVYLIWKGLMVGVTGRQGMLTPPRHLIPPLVFPGVRVRLICSVDCSIYLNWTLIWLQIFLFTWRNALLLTVDCSVCLIWTHWFSLLIFAFDMGLMAGVTSRQGMLTHPRHLIPPLIYSEVRVCISVCVFQPLKKFLNSAQEANISVNLLRSSILNTKCLRRPVAYNSNMRHILCLYIYAYSVRYVLGKENSHLCCVFLDK